MKRIAFTIAYNCLHHFRHNDFAQEMLKNFDRWVIIEGASGTGGSTSWCKDFERSPISTDGTREFILDLAKKNPGKILFILPEQKWSSKDQMVNAAIKLTLDNYEPPCYLWQVDADELWSGDQLSRAEAELERQGAKTGKFLCDYYLSSDLFARGEWGEGKALPYNRLWKWSGEAFKTHEPPVLEGGNGKEVLISERFKHFAYYFEKDVHFKSQFYSGHEDIYKPWLNLQIEGERKKLRFPLPISYLFGASSRFSKSKTIITK